MTEGAVGSSGPWSRQLRAALGRPRVPGLVREWRHGSKRLAVVVRYDGDVQVELHLEGRRGSPFEALYVAPDGVEEEVVEDVCDFVERLLSEEIVLAVEGRPFSGGQRWLAPGELGTVKQLTFAASWLGSFDTP